MDLNHCPSEEILESVARGDSVDVWVDTHIESCSVCQRTVNVIQENNSFLEQFAGEISESNTSLHATIDAPLPEILPGGYRIEHEIHRGGQGVIYKATQIRTKRSVAVKMLILGSSASDRQKSRFEREAEIIASLRHPGIVTIYDAGRLEDGSGRFGFAMEFVDGLTIDQWADRSVVESKKDIVARLKLFAEICDAVSFAHQQGVVHRDLKPANILVDGLDKPHILDFGIAKALEPVGLGSIASMGSGRGDSAIEESVHQTQPGEFAGTLAYASPEQVSGDPRLIDMRTDVYSLGIILYQLMTGKLPYRVDDSLLSVIHRIKHEAAEFPSIHGRYIDKDIDQIVLRALRKDKELRYSSVKELHRDIELYLEGKPIDSRRDSAWYVVHKTVRRHWLVSSLSIASGFALLVIAVLMTILYIQKTAAEVDALLEVRARNLLLAHEVGQHDDGSQALSVLWSAQLKSSPGLKPPKTVQFGKAFEPLDSYWELWSFYAQNPCLKTIDLFGSHPSHATMSADGSLLVALESGIMRVWSLPELELLRDVPLGLGRELSAEMAIDHLVFSKNQESIFALTEHGAAQWKILDGSLIRFVAMSQTSSWSQSSNPNILVPEYPGTHRSLLSPNGILSVGIQNRVGIIRPADPMSFVTLDQREGQSTTLRFNDEGTLLATATVHQLDYSTARSKLSVWEMPRGTLVSESEVDGLAIGLLFGPGNKTLVWSDAKSVLHQWDYISEETPEPMWSIGGALIPFCWFGERDSIVTGADRTLRLWNSADGGGVQKLMGHSSAIYQAGSTEGTSSLFSLGYDTFKSWEPDYRPWRTVTEPDVESMQDVVISPDGSRLAWTKSDSGKYSIEIVDLHTDERVAELTGLNDLVNSLSFGREGRLIAAGGMDGLVIVWDSMSGEALHRFTEHSTPVHSVAMSPTDDILASGGNDHRVILRDLNTGELRVLEGHSQRVPKVAFGPDGRRLASCSVDGSVRVWDVRTGKLINNYRFDDYFHTIDFSPDGKTLAVAGVNQQVTLINTKSGETSFLPEEPGVIFSLAFGPEGRVVVTGDRQGNISLWDVERKIRLTRFPKHEDMILGLSISNDGQAMASCSSAFRPEIRYWNLAGLSPHIAGNLEYHANKLADKNGKEPANLAAMRRWADEIRGSD